jgi:hypothetical protein
VIAATEAATGVAQQSLDTQCRAKRDLGLEFHTNCTLFFVQLFAIRLISVNIVAVAAL